MNKVLLIGNLTRPPELRYSGETAICRFTVAIEDGYGDKKKVSYPSIVCFGKTAENCDRYLDKGRKCGIEGKLQTGSYENSKGDKVYTTDVVADRVEFLSKAESYDGGFGGGFEAVRDDDIQFA